MIQINIEPIDHYDTVSLLTPSPRDGVKVVISAYYGSGDTTVDVTTTIQNITTRRFKVDNKTLLCDPCIGVVKTLTLVLDDDTIHMYPEGCEIMTDNYQLSPYATYGADNEKIDVSNNLVDQTSPFTVNNQRFSDPCVGTIKRMTVSLTRNITFNYVEHSLADPTLWKIIPIVHIII